VVTKEPKIPYRETVTVQAGADHRHRKQTGGRGQFGEVHLRIYPLPREIKSDEELLERFANKEHFEKMRAAHYDPQHNFAFIDTVVGGTIPNQFIPAVEKGCKELLERGALAGYRIQDVAVEVFFGKDHPVDSSEQAFKTAAANALRKAFDKATAGHNVDVVAEGETFYNPANALKAAQTMLQAHSDLNVIVGADQGATGAQQALTGQKVTLIGYGGGGVGLKAVASGAWYGTVVQRPATEGKLAMQCAIKAVKTGKGCGGIDVLKGLPDGGVVTQANASQFKAEWPG